VSPLKKSHIETKTEERKRSYLGSKAKTLAMPEEESKKGIPIFVALFNNALCPTCRASNFPNVTTPLTKSHASEASGWWKLFLLHFT